MTRTPSDYELANAAAEAWPYFRPLVRTQSARLAAPISEKEGS